MYRTAIGRFASLILFVTLPAAAQTLQHRPAAPPPTPAAPVKPLPALAQPGLAPGTSLQVEITRSYPMKAGELVEGRLLHPLYVDGKLAVPQGATVRGRVVALEPDKQARLHARLMGDFTPFHKPQVQFDSILLPGGPAPIVADAAADGAPLLQLSAPGASPKKALVSRQIAMAKQRLRDRVSWFTSPGLGDRSLQLLYHQLPYHPQRIDAQTAWSFELREPLALSSLPADPASPLAPPAAGKPETWAVHAVLTGLVTSASARPGDPVNALVVEPVYDRQDNLVVPQGSVLVGKVTAAKPARSFGRNGKLRFTFQQVRFPEGFGKPVEGALAGAATQKTQDLEMDAEGTISPRNKSSAVAPLLLTMLAGRALDQDGSLAGNNAVASNGFGLVGRIVGVAAGNRNFAAGLGYYAASLSFYENFLRPGRDVVFPRDTRIEIETTPLRAPVLTPGGQ